MSIWKKLPVCPSGIQNVADYTSLCGKLLSYVPAIKDICLCRDAVNVNNYQVVRWSSREFKGTNEAVKMISQAIDNDENIIVAGDYDVDGMTATAVLFSALYQATKNSKKVMFTIPKRSEGYGLNVANITKLYPSGLIITVDNGIANVDEVKQLKQLGYKVIITDHHLNETGVLPEADVIVDPKITASDKEDAYYTSGCDVARVVATELLHLRGVYSRSWEKYANVLTAFSYIADVITLRTRIRNMLRSGMIDMYTIEHAGIHALFGVCNFKCNQEVTSTYLAFNIIPKLNAAGRMNDTDKAMIVLLMNKDDSFGSNQALVAANNLKALNAQRKIIEEAIYEQAKLSIVSLKSKHSIVVYNKDWMIGVLGIVASRLVEDYKCPVIVLGGEDMLHGSGRAPNGCDLYGSLQKCNDLLERSGGHRTAAGVSISSTNLEAFRTKFDTVCGEEKATSELSTDYDSDIHIRDLFDIRLQLFLHNVEPTGAGNPAVVFKLSKVKLVNVTTRNQTTNYIVSDEDGSNLLITKYKGTEDIAPIGSIIDILISPDVSFYTGTVIVNWRLVDVHCEEIKHEEADYKPTYKVFTDKESYLNEINKKRSKCEGNKQ